MKKLSLTILCCMLVTFASLSGCGHETEGNISSGLASTTQEQTEATEMTASETTMEPSENATDSSFNMAETISASYVCGVQLSPDMTWGMLGSDFTVESGDFAYSEKTMRFPVALTTRDSMLEESLSRIANSLGILQAIPKYFTFLSRTMIWINLMLLRSLLLALSLMTAMMRSIPLSANLR
ncbi:MAG TPA: hypothetical protein PLH83_12355 [Ruminococcus sp.]|nr:hypothetical protein [Ruminococcus sp.]